MQIAVIAVGKLRPYYQEAAYAYLARLRPFWPVEMLEVREAAKAGSELVQRREEAKRITRALPRDPFVIAVSREGQAWSSTSLSAQVVRWRETGRALAFVIGGPVGLAKDFLDDAKARWSLGPLTLPHQLARIIVLEQLYRAATLHHGHPYHKAGGGRGGGLRRA